MPVAWNQAGWPTCLFSESVLTMVGGKVVYDSGVLGGIPFKHS
jgi:hypothetical protein